MICWIMLTFVPCRLPVDPAFTRSPAALAAEHPQSVRMVLSSVTLHQQVPPQSHTHSHLRRLRSYRMAVSCPNRCPLISCHVLIIFDDHTDLIDAARLHPQDVDRPRIRLEDNASMVLPHVHRHLQRTGLLPSTRSNTVNSPNCCPDRSLSADISSPLSFGISCRIVA